MKKFDHKYLLKVLLQNGIFPIREDYSKEYIVSKQIPLNEANTLCRKYLKKDNYLFGRYTQKDKYTDNGTLMCHDINWYFWYSLSGLC